MPDQLTEVRDQIAEMLGWSITDAPTLQHNPPAVVWRKGDKLSWVHPIPDSLDFVSRVWPDGWEWWRSEGRWTSGRMYVSLVLRIIDTGDELTDRMTLLLKVLHWLRDNDRPAFDAACEKIRKECGK